MPVDLLIFFAWNYKACISQFYEMNANQAIY